MSITAIEGISDGDVADTERCSEIDWPPRMHVWPGAWHRISGTVDSTAGHPVGPCTDLTGGLF